MPVTSHRESDPGETCPACAVGARVLPGTSLSLDLTVDKAACSTAALDHLYGDATTRLLPRAGSLVGAHSCYSEGLRPRPPSPRIVEFRNHFGQRSVRFPSHQLGLQETDSKAVSRRRRGIILWLARKPEWFQEQASHSQPQTCTSLSEPERVGGILLHAFCQTNTVQLWSSNRVQETESNALLWGA